MKELIGDWAMAVSLCCTAGIFLSLTVAAVADDNALWAAIWSPVAVIILIAALAIVADTAGWITLSESKS